MRAAQENHPQHVIHVQDTINYVNSVADHYAEVIVRTIEADLEKKIREEVREALNDKQTEIKVDEKSVQSVSKTIRELLGTIGR